MYLWPIKWLISLVKGIHQDYDSQGGIQEMQDIYLSIIQSKKLVTAIFTVYVDNINWNAFAVHVS